MQETQVRSLGQEDPLEQGMATHSRILDLEIPQMEEPGVLQSLVVAKRWTRLSDYLDILYKWNSTICGLFVSGQPSLLKT